MGVSRSARPLLRTAVCAWQSAPEACNAASLHARGAGPVTAIGILGSAGRMGQAIAATISDLGATLAGGIDSDGDPMALARSADVLVDFTAPNALKPNLDAARAAGTPIVVGTTGLHLHHHAMIDAA